MDARTARRLRELLILNASVQSIKNELGILAIFTSFTIPVGVAIFHAGYNAARSRGSLLEY